MDHDDLNADERRGENYARLRLFAGVTRRMQMAMHALELEVEARRHARGVQETPRK